MKRILVFSAILLSIWGCKKKNADNDKLTFYNDLEKIKCWASPGLNNLSTITLSDEAYSGRFVTLTDTTNRFGYIFLGSFKEINVKPVTKATVSMWVKFKSMNSNGKIVLSVDSAGKSINWLGVELRNVVKKPNEWTEVTAEMYFRKGENMPDKSFAFYLWNVGSDVILGDDYKVTFTE